MQCDLTDPLPLAPPSPRARLHPPPTCVEAVCDEEVLQVTNSGDGQLLLQHVIRQHLHRSMDINMMLVSMSELQYIILQRHSLGSNKHEPTPVSAAHAVLVGVLCCAAL